MDAQPRLLTWHLPATAYRPARVVLVLYWVALALGTHWPELSLPVEDPGTVWQVNKMLHAGGFGGLCLLLIAARPMGRGVGEAGNALAGCLIAACYSVVDEWTQVFVGRNASVSDGVANLLGILAVYLVVLGAGPSRGWRALPVYGARAFWLLAAPTLALIAVLPLGDGVMLWFLGLFTEPRLGMSTWVHLVLAGLLTWLLALAAPAGRRRPHLSVAVAIGLMALAGPSIEQIQAHTGRGYSVNDVYFHYLGMLAAMTGWALVATVAALRGAGEGRSS